MHTAKYAIVVTLTAAAVYAGAATASADPTTDFNNALGTATNQFSDAAAVGSIGGGVIGLGVGCLVGAATGAALTPPVFLPGMAGGCIAGASVGAGLGTAIGAATVGIPVGVASAIQMYETLHAAGDIAKSGRILR